MNFLSKKLIATLIIFLTLLSCFDEEYNNLDQAEDINLVFETFILEKKNNPHLKEDIVFNIKNNSVNGDLKTYFFNSIPTFSTNAKTVEIDNIEQISSSTIVDFRKPIVYKLKSESGNTNTYNVSISWDDSLAHIYIDTEGGAPIISKEKYIYAKLKIDGQSKYEDKIIELSQKARIKGRGNSSWGFPKKSFKIKLNNKEILLSDNDSLSRLLPEKDWVLLSDYQDGVHLLNNVAFKIGRMLEMPFTNTIIPVELTLNNEYMGLYGLTEQLEIKKNRINVGKSGVLLEIDQYFDEDWQFKSIAYNLPIMVKDPKLDNQAELDVIQTEWNNFETLIFNEDFPNNKIYRNYFAKGHYFKYSGKSPFSNLIYPVSGQHSLGIHIGFDLAGGMRFGPDVEFVDEVDYSFNESLKNKFIESISQYWPDINSAKLHPDYTGIRPKITKPNETMRDFSIQTAFDHGIKNFINLQGIESPGLTSSLAIGKFVKNLL